MPVELRCVREGGRLRMRISAYITDAGVRHENVYDQRLNCRFPRDLRVEGRVYTVPDGEVRLLGGSRVAHYYAIGARGVVIGDGASPRPLRVFESSAECCVCLNAPSAVAFAPCGHVCVCIACAAPLERCCICRARVTAIVPR